MIEYQQARGGVPRIITVDTKLIPLLGKPLRQSISPYMQNAAYHAMGLDACYFPIEVEDQDLGTIIAALRVMNVPGFALTTPHKIEVLQYLDQLDELAAKMGACNTVVNCQGVLKGYNTDGQGAVMNLIQEGVDLASDTFFLYGAGGTGKAVAYTLAHHGAKKIYIVSRSNTCEDLARDLNGSFGPVASPCRAAEEEKMLEMVRNSTVLLNLSGVGMYPDEGETWIKKEALSHKPVCFDATYNPQKTQFLLDAEEMGCKIINGLGMIINQGALQVKLWTGQREPYAEMTQAVNELLARQRGE